MDACGWDCLCSGPAFNTGLIYGNLDEALDVVNKWDKTELLNAYKDAPKKGLSTQLMGKDLFYWSSLILNISKKGLSNRNVLNKKNMNEEKFLDHLFRIIENKKTILYHMCFANSSNDQKSLLNEIYKSDDSNKVEKAKKLFVETKADQAALNLVKKYSDLAIKSINDLDVNQSKKQELIDLSQLLLTRKF